MLKSLSFRSRTLRQWLFVFGGLGLMFISGVAGALMMHFKVGPAQILEKSFVGMQALMDRGRQKELKTNSKAHPEGLSVDIPEQTDDGFTLVTLLNGSQARLIDMKGEIVHKWYLPFSKAWPHPTHVKSPLPDDQVDWYRAHLFPNGDLLAVYQTGTDTPHGYGLAKMNRDSQVIWTYSQNAHHDVDVTDDGTIYALTHQLSNKRPAGLDMLPVPYLTDYLVVLSPDGQELDKISILEALRDSPYSLLLSSMNNLLPSVILPSELTAPREPSHVRQAPPPGQAPGPDLPPGQPKAHRPIHDPQANRGVRSQIVAETGDVLHANSVKVLRPEMAAKFRRFKAGQVMISLRQIDTILVLDIPTRSVVWATQNIWRGQHDAEFLDNGHLLIFDNYGSSHMSRVIEFDPDTCAMPWSYSNENSKPFLTIVRGMKRRLPNGNTLVVDPELCRIFEVTLDKKLVWEFGTGKSLTGAVRYRQDQLSFLGNRSPRP